MARGFKSKFNYHYKSRYGYNYYNKENFTLEGKLKLFNRNAEAMYRINFLLFYAFTIFSRQFLIQKKMYKKKQ